MPSVLLYYADFFDSKRSLPNLQMNTAYSLSDMEAKKSPPNSSSLTACEMVITRCPELTRSFIFTDIPYSL